MKKALILLLLLLVAFLTPLGALAADLRFLNETGDGGYRDQISCGAARVGDTLYFHGYEAIYRWKPGDTELTNAFQKYDINWGGEDLPEAAPTEEPPSENGGKTIKTGDEFDIGLMFDLDGVPATVNFLNDKVYTIGDGVLTETEYRFMLDSMPGTTGESYIDVGLIQDAVYENGKLYMQCRPSDTQWDDAVLNVCDLYTGEITTVTDTKERILGIANYKPGKLLIASSLSYNAQATNTQDYFMKLRTWDMAKGDYDEESYTPFEGYNTRFADYEMESDTIYFFEGNRVFAAKWGETPQVVAYLNGDTYSEFPSIVIGASLAYISWEGILISSVDPAHAPKYILKVSGGYSDDASQKFSAEHPEVAVDFADMDMYHVEGVTTAIASGTAPDIYIFEASGDVDALIDKGYAADLSGSAELMAHAQALYPQFQEAIFRDGKLYGYPRSLSLGFWTYSPAAFEEMGLGEFPETMSEFIDLVALWDRDYQEDYPDKKLIDFYDDPKGMLFSLILTQYMDTMSKPDEPLSFNTPEFREVMEKLDRLPVDFKQYDDTASRGMIVYDREYVEPMIETYAFIGNLQHEPHKEFVCPPRLSEAWEPQAPSYLWMYIINPESEQKDLAMEYILYMAENMEVADRYAINPSLNEPVKDPESERYYLRELEMYEEMKNMEVEPSNQRAYEAELENQERYLAESEGRIWKISEKTIANYRALAQYITINSSNTWFSGDSAEEMTTILKRYMEGQLSTDQMIREMDQKSQMIFLETR